MARVCSFPAGKLSPFKELLSWRKKPVPIDREPKTLQAGVEETRASLGDKLETLEEGIKDAWHGATAAATRMAAGVKSAAETTAHAVQGAAETTVHAVQGAAETTVHAVQVRLQRPLMPFKVRPTAPAKRWGGRSTCRPMCRRNPWAMMGGAMLLGVAAGYLIGRLRR